MNIKFEKKSAQRIVVTYDQKSIAINPSNYDVVLDESGIWLANQGDIDKNDTSFMPIAKSFSNDDIDWANSNPVPQVTPATNEQAYNQLINDFFLT